MADSRWDEDNIALLKFVTLGSHQILRVAGVSAAKNLVEYMAVKLKIVVAVTDILVCINIGRVHFQFLIEGTGADSHFVQKLLCFRRMDIRACLG